MSLAVVFEPCERICLRKKVVSGIKCGLSHIGKEPQTLMILLRIPEVSHYQSAVPVVTAEWQRSGWGEISDPSLWQCRPCVSLQAAVGSPQCTGSWCRLESPAPYEWAGLI